MKLSDLTDTYFKSPHYGYLSESSQRAYKRDIRHLEVYLGDCTSLEEISPEQAYFVLQRMQDDKLSNNTINTSVATLKRLWEWGVVSLGLDKDKNPGRLFNKLRHEPEDKKGFTKEELDLLIRRSYLYNRGQLLALKFAQFLFGTALRPSEAVNLTEGDLEVERKIGGGIDTYLAVRSAKSREKGKVARFVFVTEEIMELLSWSRAARDGMKSKSDNLWVSTRGNPIDLDNVRINFKKICYMNGLGDRELYDLRRGSLTAIINDPRYGIPVAQKVAGHKDISTTMKYERIGKKDAAKLFQGI